MYTCFLDVLHIVDTYMVAIGRVLCGRHIRSRILLDNGHHSVCVFWINKHKTRTMYNICTGVIYTSETHTINVVVNWGLSAGRRGSSWRAGHMAGYWPVQSEFGKKTMLWRSIHLFTNDRIAPAFNSRVDSPCGITYNWPALMHFT